MPSVRAFSARAHVSHRRRAGRLAYTPPPCPRSSPKPAEGHGEHAFAGRRTQLSVEPVDIRPLVPPSIASAMNRGPERPAASTDARSTFEGKTSPLAPSDPLGPPATHFVSSFCPEGLLFAYAKFGRRGYSGPGGASAMRFRRGRHAGDYRTGWTLNRGGFLGQSIESQKLERFHNGTQIHGLA
jgi:hypothetical protein